MADKMEKDLLLILKKVSRTLYLSISILPEYVKNMLSAGYLICRAMDSVCDAPDIENYRKKEILEKFDLLLNENSEKLLIVLSEIAGKMPDKWESALLKDFKLVKKFCEQFSAEDKMLLKELYETVREGMYKDLQFFDGKTVKAFLNDEDLLDYCRKIGGAPGVFWFKVYNNHLKGKLKDPDMQIMASQMGSALQLTNILKDFSKDLAKKRCYIPQSDLAGALLSFSDLTKADNMRRFKPIISKWIVQAVDFLDSSENFLFRIEKSNFAIRAAVVWPVYWAMDTLHETALSNILEKSPKIKRKVIYATIFKTPSLLLSNSVFQRGYRFRRETLITSLSSDI